MENKTHILIRVQNHNIHTQQFECFHLAQVQMFDEMVEMGKIPESIFKGWNGMTMLEDGGKYGVWSDGGYSCFVSEIDWQIVEVE